MGGREAGWSESVAVGQVDFVRQIEEAPGGMARGRKVRKVDIGYGHFGSGGVVCAVIH